MAYPMKHKKGTKVARKPREFPDDRGHGRYDIKFPDRRLIMEAGCVNHSRIIGLVLICQYDMKMSGRRPAGWFYIFPDIK